MSPGTFVCTSYWHLCSPQILLPVEASESVTVRYAQMSSPTFYQCRGRGLTRGPSFLGRVIFNLLLRNPQLSLTEPVGHWFLRTLTQLPQQIIFKFRDRASLGKERKRRRNSLLHNEMHKSTKFGARWHNKHVLPPLCWRDFSPQLNLCSCKIWMSSISFFLFFFTSIIDLWTLSSWIIYYIIIRFTQVKGLFLTENSIS